MSEAARPIEWGLEKERQIHIAAVVKYIIEGSEANLQQALEFFDHDAATLMHLLDKLRHQLDIDASQKDDLTTASGRLQDLRDLFTPPPQR